MLDVIGVKSLGDLFDSIPEALRMQSWNLPPGMSEFAVRGLCEELAAGNEAGAVSFLGGGYYDHAIPAAVDALSGRAEFYTAYTPYQAEASQGTLQAIYEYQSVICRLTGMDYANASLYDGGTAVYEAVLMALRITRRGRVALHPGLNPRFREMLLTHTANLGIDIDDSGNPEGAACVIAQTPDFHGTLHDFTELAAECRAAGALLALSVYPVALGLMKSPGEMGADIAIAEGQSIGMPLGFGGPYLGVMAVRKEHVRKMPGRIAGETVDLEGRRGFVLTLQAREQHIRRGKAMSNICTNQALCALRALIHLCLLGREGLREVARACHAKSEYLKSRLDFGQIMNPGPTFNEFTLRLPKPAAGVVEQLRGRGFHAGLPLEVFGGDPHDLLIAVTEKRSRAELDAFAAALKEAACN